MPVVTRTIRDPEHFVAYTDTSGVARTAPRDVQLSVFAPPTPGTYPVIIYSHGHWGSGRPDSGAGAVAQALADQGYIVIAPTHLDSASTYPSWFTSQFSVSNVASGLHRSADMQFALDQATALVAALPGYTVDTSRPVAAGHSHGAFTAGLVTGLQSDQYADLSLPDGNPYGVASVADVRFAALLLLSPQGLESSWAQLSSGAWDAIDVPMLILTGTADSEPGGLVGWESRLDSFGRSAGGETAALVYRDAAHNDIGGNTDNAAITASIAGFAAMFLDAYLTNDPAARDLFASAQALISADPLLSQAFARPAPNTAGSGVVVGGEGADVLRGLSSFDVLRGEAGDDILIGGGGSDLIEGGSGWDEARFSGEVSDYVVHRTGMGALVKNAAGATVLNDVELIRFDDGAIDLTLIVCDPGGEAQTAKTPAPLVRPDAGPPPAQEAAADAGFLTRWMEGAPGPSPQPHPVWDDWII
ncbi:hypothetical protein [Brevundimonas sp.]|uniref:alpha/beta hydrolase family protein n=1 Tax=Brevundimonas sp. TaxID=1871086 RepID=UPI0025D28B69|nr:hypothetical protein [Brevundimonas sp.]